MVRKTTVSMLYSSFQYSQGLKPHVILIFSLIIFAYNHIVSFHYSYITYFDWYICICFSFSYISNIHVLRMDVGAESVSTFGIYSHQLAEHDLRVY